MVYGCFLCKKVNRERKVLSYREEFVLGTEKTIRPTEMFEFSSVRVMEIFLA